MVKSKKYTLKKRNGGTNETLKSRYNRVNHYFEELEDHLEEEYGDNPILPDMLRDLNNQINIFYKLAEKREEDCKNELKKMKSNYDKLIAELVLIKKKYPDFVSENVTSFLG